MIFKVYLYVCHLSVVPVYLCSCFAVMEVSLSIHHYGGDKENIHLDCFYSFLYCGGEVEDLQLQTSELL